MVSIESISMNKCKKDSFEVFMNWFEKIVYLLQAEMEEPTVLSSFHIMAVVFTLLFTVGACIWFVKKPNEKALRRFIFVCWLIMAAFEIYKQVVFAFDYNVETGVVTWDYEWYSFPFQFCSTPLYLFPFVALLKDGKVRNSIIAFLSTFALAGGLIVMAYPGTVFIPMIGINIQTMVHHGLQLTIGVLLVVFYRKKLNFKTFLTGIIVYGVIISIAMALNLLVPLGVDETFNMFFISPKYECELPLLNVVYDKTPYMVFFLIYLIGFILIALIVFGILKLVYFLIKYIEKKTNKQALPTAAVSAQTDKLHLLLPLFLMIESFLWADILFLDVLPQRISCFLSIVFVCLFAFAFFESEKPTLLLNIGLIATVCADSFLILPEQMDASLEIAGVLCFSVTQLLYFGYLWMITKKTKQKLIHTIVRCAAILLVEIVHFILLKDSADILSALSVFYVTNLVVNAIFAYAQGKKCLLFAIGLTLFLCCDIFVGLSAAIGVYFDVASTSLLYKIVFSDFNFIWFFYLPSQVLISSFVPYRNIKTLE